VRNLIAFYGARDLVAFDSLNTFPAGWSAGSDGPQCSAAANPAARVSWRLRSMKLKRVP